MAAHAAATAKVPDGASTNAAPADWRRPLSVSAIVASVGSVTAMTVGLARDRRAGTDVTIARRMVPAIQLSAVAPAAPV